MTLDWDDMQGNILRGYGFEHGSHAVLAVTDPAAGRRWLAELVPEVTPATPWSTKPATTLNVAFTHRGLAELVPDPDDLSFPEDFSQGMRERAAARLGDSGHDAPEHWESHGPQHPRAHVLLMIHAHDAATCEERTSHAVARAEAQGLELLATQRLQNLPGGIEHFGFADGISQPAVEGAVEPTVVRGNGTPLKDGTWRPVQPGEFVLGYRDEEEPAPPLPEPHVLARNGSYLVYRKLAQNVATFRQTMASLGEEHGVSAELLGAKLVGRHADGTPLLPGTGTAPGPGNGSDGPGNGSDGAAPQPGAHPSAWLNDMRFESDPLGRACPVGSHIRRANPRDGFDLPPELVSRHRLLRRGMPYGPPLPDGVMEDDGTPRGLLFLAYCASISRQFEFTQRWLNDGNPFGAGYTADPIAGHGRAPRRFACEAPSEAAPDGSRPLICDGIPPLVHTKGGEYLFQPGLEALRFLAGA